MQWSLFPLILMGQCSFFMCHLYQYHFITKSKTWHEAQAYCRKKYTDLAIVYNETDIERLREAAQKQDREAWIGLYNITGKHNRTWHWSLPGVEYQENETQWAEKEPNDNWDHDVENCVAIRSVDHNSCFDDNCHREHGFICYDEKKRNNKTFHFIKEERTWSEAQDYCREHHTDLLSGHNQLKELRDVSSEMQVINDAWIGLFRDSWRWSDGGKSSFRNWKKQFNDRDHRRCAKRQKNGEWDSGNCVNRKRFFCYDDNMILIKEDKTWEEAIDHCRENYNDLISITDPEQQRWVQERAKKASSSHVWLGLHYTCVLDVWFWVTNERLIYQNWASDVVKDDCDMSGAMETRGEHKWSKKKNMMKFNFFCSRV